MLRAWVGGALAVAGGAAVRGLGRRLELARRPDLDRTSPGSTTRPDSATSAAILVRNSLVLALHAIACVAGFIAGSSLRALGGAPDRRLALDPREGAADRARLGRSWSPASRWSPRPTRSGSPAPSSPTSSRSRPAALVLTVLPARDPGAGRRSSCRSPPGRSPAAATSGTTCSRRPSPPWRRDPDADRRGDLGGLRLAADPRRGVAGALSPPGDARRLRRPCRRCPRRAGRGGRPAPPRRRESPTGGGARAASGAWSRGSPARGSPAIRSASSSARATTSPAATSRTIPSRWASARVDDPAGQAELLGDRRRAAPRAPPRSSAGSRAAARGSRSVAECRGDPQVAEQREREAAGERRAVDRGDHRALAVADRLEGERAGLDQALAVARGRRRTGSCPCPSRTRFRRR